MHQRCSKVEDRGALELIETTPCAALNQSAEDAAHCLVVEALACQQQHRRECYHSIRMLVGDKHIVFKKESSRPRPMYLPIQHSMSKLPIKSLGQGAFSGNLQSHVLLHTEHKMPITFDTRGGVAEGSCAPQLNTTQWIAIDLAKSFTVSVFPAQCRTENLVCGISAALQNSYYNQDTGGLQDFEQYLCAQRAKNIRACLAKMQGVQPFMFYLTVF